MLANSKMERLKEKVPSRASIPLQFIVAFGAMVS